MTDNAALIEAAAELLHPHYEGDRLMGDVASVLVTEAGNRHAGVCIDTSSGTGFCAEAAAIGAMVTAGEYAVAEIVAVWRDVADGRLFVLPPCGRCREFIRAVHAGNEATRVVLGESESATLRELLPRLDWPDPLADRFTSGT